MLVGHKICQGRYFIQEPSNPWSADPLAPSKVDYQLGSGPERQIHPSDSDAGGIPPRIKHGDELCARNLFMLVFFVE